jgi:rhodanese-related sulfurtransferase
MEAQSADEVELPPARVAELLDAGGAVLIDVREPDEWEAGHVPGARHVRLASLPAEAETIDRERPVIFGCRSGNRSRMAAEAFRESGYDAYNMAGGLSAWAAEGRPLEPQGGHVA